jgi:hypothetical protein
MHQMPVFDAFEKNEKFSLKTILEFSWFCRMKVKAPVSPFFFNI